LKVFKAWRVKGLLMEGNKDPIHVKEENSHSSQNSKDYNWRGGVNLVEKQLSRKKKRKEKK
jgi:hypothetical protein